MVKRTRTQPPGRAPPIARTVNRGSGPVLSNRPPPRSVRCLTGSRAIRHRRPSDRKLASDPAVPGPETAAETAERGESVDMEPDNLSYKQAKQQPRGEPPLSTHKYLTNWA